MRNNSGRYIKLCGMLLMMVALLLAPAPVKADEDNYPASPNPQTALCKGLKPYNNLDEFINQFADETVSDCLFSMPAAELEKLWGIKILSEGRRAPKTYYQLSRTDFYYKPYETERDAFYVEMPVQKNDKSKNVFIIKITKAYFDKHGGLCQGEDCVKLLRYDRSAEELTKCVRDSMLFCNLKPFKHQLTLYVTSGRDVTELILINRKWETEHILTYKP